MADLRWNSINANFNDSNSAMANAQRGISNVGTVFGELRKSILAQEQLEIENAYKQKAFDEQVRQFGLKHNLDERRFGLSENELEERRRQFDTNQILERDRLAQALDIAKMNNAVAWAGVNANQERNRLAANRDARDQYIFDQQQENRQVWQRALQAQFGDLQQRKDVVNELEETMSKLDPSSREYQVAQNELKVAKNAVNALSANQMFANAYQAVAPITGDYSLLSKWAETEQERSVNNAKFENEQKKFRNAAISNAYTNVIDKAPNATNAEKQKMLQALVNLTSLKEFRNNADPTLLAHAIKNMAADRKFTSYLSNFGFDRQGVDYSNQSLLDIVDKSHPLAQMLLPYASLNMSGNELATLNKEMAEARAAQGMPSDIPPVLPEAGNLTNASEEGLQYRLKASQMNREAKAQYAQKDSPERKQIREQLASQLYPGYTFDKLPKKVQDELDKRASTVLLSQSMRENDLAEQAIRDEEDRRKREALYEQWLEQYGDNF